MSEKSNFWKCCPLKLEYMPEEPCEKGSPDSNKLVSCPWGINSPDHNFCFWTFIKEKSNEDGSLEPLLQSEIASLLNCSSTKVHFLLKEALERLNNLPEMKELKEMLQESGLSEGSISNLLGLPGSFDLFLNNE